MEATSKIEEVEEGFATICTGITEEWVIEYFELIKEASDFWKKPLGLETIKKSREKDGNQL